MLSHKKITELLANWGMEKEKVSDVVFKETGEISDTAKYVGDGYVIKYTNNLANVVKAINISKALDNVGLSSATVVPTKDGKEYVECGELYVFLSTRVAGEGFLASKVYLDEYEKKARFIGEIVGQLDLALAKIDVPVKVTDTYSAVCDWALPSLKDKMELPQGFVEEYTKAFEGLYKAIPRQIIHRDPNPSNIIVSGEKWGFIDFELSEENVRIFDPCYAATAILSETFEEGNEEKMDRWGSVLQQIMSGYDSVVRLSDEEKNAIPYIILANQFVATAWFAGMEKYQELYKTNVKMTEWIIRNFSKMQLEF